MGATLSFLLAKEAERGAPAGQEGQRELAVPGSWVGLAFLGDVLAPCDPNCKSCDRPGVLRGVLGAADPDIPTPSRVPRWQSCTSLLPGSQTASRAGHRMLHRHTQLLRSLAHHTAHLLPRRPVAAAAAAAQRLAAAGWASLPSFAGTFMRSPSIHMSAAAANVAAVVVSAAAEELPPAKRPRGRPRGSKKEAAAAAAGQAPPSTPGAKAGVHTTAAAAAAAGPLAAADAAVDDAALGSPPPSTATRKKKSARAAASPSHLVLSNRSALEFKAQRIAELLGRLYPNPPVPLDHASNFQLLCAVLLSAQVRAGGGCLACLLECPASLSIPPTNLKGPALTGTPH